MKVVIVNSLASAFQVHIHQNRATDRSNFVSRKRCNPTKVTSLSFFLALFLSLFFFLITQLRYLTYSTTCTCRQFITDRVTLEKGVAAFEEKHSVERLVMKFLEITELDRKTMKVLNGNRQRLDSISQADISGMQTLYLCNVRINSGMANFSVLFSRF